MVYVINVVIKVGFCFLVLIVIYWCYFYVIIVSKVFKLIICLISGSNVVENYGNVFDW